ncbi:N-acetylmuramoyl-L-alanine amidase [Georgenia satyanarayanai]|uniref:N-acetylmuramoyl-L-alanine amidase n=1 Tax=Georgenia satyanarayanai TaxID=860221 RepID=A0A2Y9ARJ6_9MICO|nr:N-acetylmuramoyl-L-alanine amidase [Georgenia satyanarayanai]PYF96299.1 N-acetylmuramoyl-L-alanine amidase [Georgenia satyanarayanai]SSA47081.1 N-acetylmuramoyl-L-alanine amidase [Georgenia satyanarayanai]
MAGLTAVGVLAPAAQGVEEPPGGDAVVVLELTDGDGVPTDLAAGVQVDGAVLTDELDVPEFSVAAVTWDGLDAPDESFSVRVRAGGEWTAWAELEPDAAVAGDVGGTEPYVVGGATAVQLRVAAGDGVLPHDVHLHLIPPEPGDQEAVARTSQETARLAATAGTGTSAAPAGPATTEARSATPEPAATHARAAAPAPRVIHRAGWGADESMMTWTPRHDPLRAAVVHHTAGSNSYTAAQSAGIVRGIYHYHAVTRDWGDIGYHFLVDKYGQVFEGRAGSLTAPPGRLPEAAHARGFNRGTLGISVLGDYSSLYAPDSVLDTMARVIAWKFDAADIDMSAPSGMISPGTAHRPAGQTLPRVFAHRDVGATTCPGDNIYARIPRLNEQVATLVDGDDYHLRNSLTGGDADLAFRLGLSTDEVLVGDWDGDGRETLALRRGSTYLVYDAHPGQRFRTVRYGRPGDVVLVGDWDGDGKDTLAVRRGQTYHVKNSMTGGDADAVIHYGRPRDDVLVGDWNGDGRDTLSLRRGADYHVKNRIAGGDADVVLRYGRANDIVLVGDWDRDGSDTFAVRRGREYHVRNSLTGGDAHVVLTYGRADDVVLVGDWDGDGRDTFAVRRSG